MTCMISNILRCCQYLPIILFSFQATFILRGKMSQIMLLGRSYDEGDKRYDDEPSYR
jgi:hypothetical protein